MPLAKQLPGRWSFALLLAIEAAGLAIYRDNLALNLLMMVFPLGSIKSWLLNNGGRNQKLNMVPDPF